jgi:hypothetical protein
VSRPASIEDAPERRIEGALRAGELSASGSASELARIAAATLRSSAVRARADASRAAPARLASAAVNLTCARS